MKLIPNHNQWTTPPAQDNTSGSNTGPRGYQLVKNLYDVTNEVGDTKDSNICLLEAKEHVSMVEGLVDEC